MTTALALMSTGADLQAKVEAFQQIGALVNARLFPQGIDTVQKAIAVCWMADAVGVHPMVALQECYVVHGKVGFSWRMKLGLVQSRVPGFEYEEVRATAEECVLRGRRAPTDAWVEVAYTRAQATRQGLVKQNPLYESDWPDMSFKQAMHRLLDRVAGFALRGLPTPELPSENGAPTTEPSSAAVVDEEVGAALDQVVEVGTTQQAKAPEPEWRGLLAARLREFYGGKLTKAALLEKTAIVWNQMQKEQTGEDPKRRFARADEIGPVEAKQMCAYLDQHQGRLAERDREREAEAVEDAPPIAEFDQGEADDAGPPPEEEGPPQVEQAAVAEAPWYGDLTSFMRLVMRARKVTGRQIVQESPRGSGAQWLTDHATFSARGCPGSVQLTRGGEQIIEPEALAGLAKAMGELYDIGYGAEYRGADIPV